MARVVPIALFLATVSGPAWLQAAPPGDRSIPPSAWRISEDRQAPARRNFQSTPFLGEEDDRSANLIFRGTEISPNAAIGLGMFGFKPDRAHQAPVTGRELGIPRTRRAGFGVRLKL